MSFFFELKSFPFYFCFERREKEFLNLKYKQRLVFPNVDSTLRELVTRKREPRDESEKFGENRQYFGNTRVARFGTQRERLISARFGYNRTRSAKGQPKE